MQKRLKKVQLSNDININVINNHGRLETIMGYSTVSNSTIQTVSGNINIVMVRGSNTQTLTLPLQQELLEGDLIDIRNKYEIHNWEKIASYNGETINTEWISSTGSLSTGATVYYKLNEPKLLVYTEAQQTILNQLSDIELYNGNNHIYTSNTIKPILKFLYYDVS